MAYTSRDFLVTPSVAQIAGVTDAVISKEFRISKFTAKTFRATFGVSVATVGSGITVTLQTRHSTELPWTNSKTLAITTVAALTSFHLTLLAELAGDQTYLPLATMGRFVATTAAGASFTMINAFVSMAE